MSRCPYICLPDVHKAHAAGSDPPCAAVQARQTLPVALSITINLTLLLIVKINSCW